LHDRLRGRPDAVEDVQQEGAAMAGTEPEYIEPDDGQDPDGHETVEEDRGTDADSDADADNDGGDDGS
jgi:hypothetical protein